jgi:hypothetical protein
MQVESLDGRVFMGTPVQIVQELLSLAHPPPATVRAYIEMVIDQTEASEMQLPFIPARLPDEDSLCLWFIRVMIETGLLRQHER